MNHPQPNPAAANAVDLRRLAQARGQQELQIKAQVEGLAAQIYISAIAPAAGDASFAPSYYEKHTHATVERALDAALTFAREVWGIQAQRLNAGPPPEPAKAFEESPIIQG